VFLDTTLLILFFQIGEAFDTLNDKNKRALFDQFGEDGLKGGGVPPTSHGSPSGFSFEDFARAQGGGGGGGMPQGFSFSTGPGGGNTFTFSSSSSGNINGFPFGPGGGGGGFGGTGIESLFE
jgi:DnaJ family protein B protein 4